MRPMTAQRNVTTGRVMIHVDPKTGSAPRHLPTHRSDMPVRRKGLHFECRGRETVGGDRQAPGPEDHPQLVACASNPNGARWWRAA
jgi:hypothetical protein